MSCSLCGLPAEAGALHRDFGGQSLAFCCVGCMNVYTILSESGILASGADFRQSEIYRESLRLGLISQGQALKEELPAGAEIREASYRLSGLWCASCGWLIEHALASVTGIVSAEVLFASDLLRIRYSPQFVPPGTVERRVARLGYRAGPFTGQTDGSRQERRDLLLRIGIAFFIWMNVMVLSLVIYASYWESISDTARHVVPLVLAALTLPAVFYSAWPILRVAFLGLKAFTLRMEALLALGIIAAFGYSAAQAFLGGKHYYFDTACAIITLVLLGKLLERGAKEKTSQAITLLYGMMPNKARLLAEGHERFVAVETLAAGAVFVVKTGERIPADGVVVTGESHVDESILTGESAPRQRRAGDEVIGGSLNTGGVLEIRAVRAPGESAINCIIRSVEQAMASRAPIERVVDRVSRTFVPVVILLSAFTLAGWLAVGLPAADALMRAIAVLVIACPCALGIATPLAVTAAVGAASRRGILIRDSRVLEEIGKVDLLILDKTGTVTEGDFSVLATEPAGFDLTLVAALEAYSEHPLARALARACGGKTLPAVTEVRIVKGQGIAGVCQGREVAAGNRLFLQPAGIPDEIERQARAWEETGSTVTFAAYDGQAVAAIGCGDRLRPESRGVVAALHGRGVKTILLSGDAEATTRWVASEIGASDFRAEVLPEGKRAFVEECRSKGATVAMLGDGVNDAPALAAAHLGIALGSGSDLAMQAAPVVLMSSSIGRVTEVFDIARSTLRVVRQNLFWAFFYNAAGITLAVTGVLNPILAAGAMVLSSLSVVGNSLRLNSRIGGQAKT
ncbi:MAG: heavy metal translocating P-type ATPase [Acidobacteria bacterium]|nr:heavy metal translocating P-type ATPase [Acidobacteriota bacterium]